jgi:hypothetical protein
MLARVFPVIVFRNLEILKILSRDLTGLPDPRVLCNLIVFSSRGVCVSLAL